MEHAKLAREHLLAGLGGVLVAASCLLAVSAYAEPLPAAPKSTLADTISHSEHPGREREQQPDRVIETLGVRPGDSVCDLGAGTGYFTFRLARIVGETGKVYAADINPDMLDYLRNEGAKRGATNIVLVHSDETDPKFPQSSCGMVLIVNTYRDFLAPVTTMKHVAPALKEGGEVAIIDFKEDGARGGPPTEKRVAEEVVLSQMLEAGYRLIRSHDFLKRQYFLVFRKQPREEPR